MVGIIVVLLALVGLAVLVLLAVATLAPVFSKSAERARVDRRAQEAAWRIHRQATEAFGQMLDAARQDREERP